MKRLTKEEVEQIPVYNKDIVIAEIKKLKMGEGLKINTGEWTKKTNIYISLYRIYKKERKFSVKKSEFGWTIIRIK